MERMQKVTKIEYLLLACKIGLKVLRINGQSMYKYKCESLEESAIKKYKQIFEMSEKARTLIENTYGNSNKLAQFFTLQATILLQQG